jgi:hypothetical protein
MSDWVNLQRYLELNSDQGADMGQRVYGDVSDKAQKATNQLNRDANSYSNEVQRGIVGGPKGGAGDYTEDQAAANASKSYGGPTSLDSYDPTLAGNVNKASQEVQAAADPNQRGSVIQETFGAQGASGVGGSALDNFLVGASPAGEQLAGLGKQYQNMLQSLGLAETDAYAKSQLGMAQSTANADKWAKTATEIAANKKKAADEAAGNTKNLSDEPDSSGRKGISQKQEADLQGWYNTMKNKLEKNYVGPGKRFANKEQFENYIGGVGHGFEESFSIGSAGNGGAEVGGGALWDKDRTLRMLTMLGRVAYGKYVGIGGSADSMFPGMYQEFQKYGGSGELPAEWAQDYKPPAQQPKK